MSIQTRNYGKTHVTQSFPWGLYLRNGHRLLCSDGKIRAAELAQTADTFFSVPASVRINSKRVSGYMTTESAWNETRKEQDLVYAFRHHTAHADKLPVWPSNVDGPKHDELVKSAA